MLSQLKSKQGSQVVLELDNGRQICGVLLEINESVLRMETEEGIATLSVNSVQLILESLNRSLSDEDMEEIVKSLKSKPGLHYVCPSLFVCPGTYGCVGTHSCPLFICSPGRFNDLSGGGGVAPCVGAFYGYRKPQPSDSSSEAEEQTSSTVKKTKD